MHSQPHISIIVAVYNRAATLQRCFDSVGNQDYPFKELIVIDGGSTDGTADILKANNHKISYWESEADRGIYHAFNKGLEHVTGDWVYFLGADDYLMDSGVLSRVADRLVKCEPAIRIVYGQVAIVSRDGQILAIHRKITTEPGASCLRLCRYVIKEYSTDAACLKATADSMNLLGFPVITNCYCEMKDRPAMFMADVVVAAVLMGWSQLRPGDALIVPLEEARARELNGFPVYHLAWLWVLTKAFARYSIQRSVGHEAFCRIGDLYRRLTGRRPVWTKM
jgi:glycosyltransferase involved in cell wall biosynthesis